MIYMRVEVLGAFKLIVFVKKSVKILTLCFTIRI
jgi:hypothetical protein